MADVKWIKICTDIFDDEKILLIESMPEADAIIVIWFKLLCMAGRQNNSGVFMLNDKIAYTEEMLSTILRRPLNTVRLALKTFESYGMVEIVDNVLTIPNWEKHQNLGKLEAAREKNRLKVAAHRERQKLLAGSNGYETVTLPQCNATDKDIDKDIDLDKEEEKDIDKIREIVSYLNEKVNSSYRPSTPKTQTLIKARLKEGFTLEDFKTVINKKTAEWKGTDMAQYLRPETLFGTKFEGYLNATTKTKETPQSQECKYGKNLGVVL